MYLLDHLVLLYYKTLILNLKYYDLSDNSQQAHYAVVQTVITTIIEFVTVSCSYCIKVFHTFKSASYRDKYFVEN